jgi:hypothetical protein
VPTLGGTVQCTVVWLTAMTQFVGDGDIGVPEDAAIMLRETVFAGVFGPKFAPTTSTVHPLVFMTSTRRPACKQPNAWIVGWV